MIGKYDKDFLSPDRPVPTPLNTHLGVGLRTAPNARSLRVGGACEESELLGGSFREDWRDEAQLSASDVGGVAAPGQTQADISSFQVAGATK